MSTKIAVQVGRAAERGYSGDKQTTFESSFQRCLRDGRIIGDWHSEDMKTLEAQLTH